MSIGYDLFKQRPQRSQQYARQTPKHHHLTIKVSDYTHDLGISIPLGRGVRFLM